MSAIGLVHTDVISQAREGVTRLLVLLTSKLSEDRESVHRQVSPYNNKSRSKSNTLILND